MSTPAARSRAVTGFRVLVVDDEAPARAKVK
ncbi:hypothetical protein WA016_06100 [Myxococcus stipitatus]